MCSGLRREIRRRARLRCAHQDQVRKGSGRPYVTHLLGVASLVGDAGGSEDEVIAGLLHDALEDQPDRTSYEIIRDRFGLAVADIVRACSDSEGPGPKADWRQRKERYLTHLPQSPPSALVVSCADKLHNVRTIIADLRELGEEAWSRFKGRKDGTLWYYGALVDAFARLPVPARLRDELAGAVAEMQRLAGITPRSGR
jgi:(p)ppGpp synthase/HD superfamily hydrolase